MRNTQLDLFGEIEAAEQELARKAAARAARESAFRDRATLHPDGTPVLWIAPCDTAGGMTTGDTCIGWRCWMCGQISPNEFLLGLNHGLHVFDDVVHQRTHCLNSAGGGTRAYGRESWQLRGHAG